MITIGDDDGDVCGTAGGKLTATEGGDKSGSGAGIRSSSGGDSDGGSSNHSDSGGDDAGQVRAAATLVLLRLAEATRGVAALKAQLADAIKRTTLGRLVLCSMQSVVWIRPRCTSLLLDAWF